MYIAWKKTNFTNSHRCLIYCKKVFAACTQDSCLQVSIGRIITWVFVVLAVLKIIQSVEFLNWVWFQGLQNISSLAFCCCTVSIADSQYHGLNEALLLMFDSSKVADESVVLLTPIPSAVERESKKRRSSSAQSASSRLSKGSTQKRRSQLNWWRQLPSSRMFGFMWFYLTLQLWRSWMICLCRFCNWLPCCVN